MCNHLFSPAGGKWEDKVQARSLVPDGTSSENPDEEEHEDEDEDGDP